MLRALGTFVALVAAAPASGVTFIVNVGGNSPPTFTPQTLTIHAGDTVLFRNKGGLHNVVADDGSFRCALSCANGTPSSQNWQSSITFDTPGVVGYFCEVHGAPGVGMFGTITVQAPTPVRLESFDVD